MTDWALDPTGLTARRGSQIVKLSQAQFGLLKGLLNRPGQLLTYRDVFRLMWQREPRMSEEHEVAAEVEALLDLLADDRGDTGITIAKVPGLGYCIQPIPLDSLGEALRQISGTPAGRRESG